MEVSLLLEISVKLVLSICGQSFWEHLPLMLIVLRIVVLSRQVSELLAILC